MGVIVDGDEAPAIDHQAVNPPGRLSSVDLALGVGATDRMLDSESVEEVLDAAPFCMDRPNEAFDSHCHRSYAPLWMKREIRLHLTTNVQQPVPRKMSAPIAT
jgi:hypothetical protein